MKEHGSEYHVAKHDEGGVTDIAGATGLQRQPSQSAFATSVQVIVKRTNLFTFLGT